MKNVLLKSLTYNNNTNKTLFPERMLLISRAEIPKRAVYQLPTQIRYYLKTR